MGCANYSAARSEVSKYFEKLEFNRLYDQQSANAVKLIDRHQSETADKGPDTPSRMSGLIVNQKQ